MLFEISVSDIFPSTDSMTRQPLPSPGSLGRVPRLHRYYELLRLPTARPAALRCLAWRYRPHRGGNGRTSQVPGEPTYRHAAFSDPGGSRARCRCCAPSVAFRHVDDVGSRNDMTFGAQSRGLPAPCVRFAASVARGLAQHSVPAGGKPWPDGIGYPQGSLEEFQSCLPYPLLPGFAWRTNILHSRVSRLPLLYHRTLDPKP